MSLCHRPIKVQQLPAEPLLSASDLGCAAGRPSGGGLAVHALLRGGLVILLAWLAFVIS
jgi:hypothetical protein